MLKPLTVWIITNYRKLLKGWKCQIPLPVSWETYMQVTIVRRERQRWSVTVQRRRHRTAAALAAAGAAASTRTETRAAAGPSLVWAQRLEGSRRRNRPDFNARASVPLRFSFECLLHIYIYFLIFLFVVIFVIHWNETAMGLHVFPIPIPPPTSLSSRSLHVFPVHQVWALVSWIQPGLVSCFTLDSIHVSMLFSWNIPPSPSPTESKRLFYKSVSLFLFCI